LLCRQNCPHSRTHYRIGTDFLFVSAPAFWKVPQSYDAYLKFVLLTGVTKFSRASVFSALPNLTDISLNPDYYDICGFTQKELETEFQPEIDGIVHNKGIGLVREPGWFSNKSTGLSE
jgi:hypothetical protein